MNQPYNQYNLHLSLESITGLTINFVNDVAELKNSASLLASRQ